MDCFCDTHYIDNCGYPIQVGCREHAHLLFTSRTLRGRQGPFQGTNTRCALGSTSSNSACDAGTPRNNEVDRRQLMRQGAALCGALLLAR